MKYGNLTAGSLDIDPYVADLDKKLEEGSINQEKYARKLRALKRDRLLFIAITNNAGGIRPKKHRKLSISDFKDLIHHTKVEEFVQKIKEEEALREGTDEEFTAEEMSEAEVFIDNLKKLEEKIKTESTVSVIKKNYKKERSSRNKMASKSRLKNQQR